MKGESSDLQPPNYGPSLHRNIVRQSWKQRTGPCSRDDQHRGHSRRWWNCFLFLHGNPSRISLCTSSNSFSKRQKRVQIPSLKSSSFRVFSIATQNAPGKFSECWFSAPSYNNHIKRPVLNCHHMLVTLLFTSDKEGFDLPSVTQSNRHKNFSTYVILV